MFIATFRVLNQLTHVFMDTLKIFTNISILCDKHK